MDRKKIRQQFFMARELRLSISLIVICSLLAGILFTYITKEIGAKTEHGILSFIAVFIGYLIIVIVLALFFTHRFIGPFERLKMEIRLILAGDYQRRFCVRGSDDFYIRSFITDLNKILDSSEATCLDKKTFRQNIDSEILHILSFIEKEDPSKEKLREALLSLHERIESLLGSKKK